MNYIDTVYNEKDRPLTDYPYQLCEYLSEKYLVFYSSILDYGCGRGEFSRSFKKLDFKVYSHDINYNEKYHCDLNFIDDLKYLQNEIFVDCVFLKSVLEHIEDTSFILQELKKVLSFDGKIIILVPDWKSQYKIFYDDPTHIKPFTQEGLREAMVMAGFKNVHTEVFYQLPIVWKHEWMKYVCKFISLFVKPEHYPKNKFLRWSTETMILGVGEKC